MTVFYIKICGYKLNLLSVIVDSVFEDPPLVDIWSIRQEGGSSYMSSSPHIVSDTRWSQQMHVVQI